MRNRHFAPPTFRSTVNLAPKIRTWYNKPEFNYHVSPDLLKELYPYDEALHEELGNKVYNSSLAIDYSYITVVFPQYVRAGGNWLLENLWERWPQTSQARVIRPLLEKGALAYKESVEQQIIVDKICKDLDNSPLTLNELLKIFPLHAHPVRMNNVSAKRRELISHIDTKPLELWMIKLNLAKE